MNLYRPLSVEETCEVHENMEHGWMKGDEFSIFERKAAQKKRKKLVSVSRDNKSHWKTGIGLKGAQ